MIGRKLFVPTTVCESGMMKVVGREQNATDKRFKVRGVGDVIYWCVEVVDGATRGAAFAVGSDELRKWER